MDRLLQTLTWRRRARTTLRVLLIVTGTAALWEFSVLVQEKDYVGAIAPVSLIGILSIVEFVLADLILDRSLPRSSRKFLERLQSKLASTEVADHIVQTLRDCVATFDGCDLSKVTATVHLVVAATDGGDDSPSSRLFQVFAYTNADLGGRRWRFISPTKGIVGQCVRLQRKVWVNFRTVQEYRERMVKDFGFTSEEAARHTRTARSYLAVPLLSSGTTYGVMYFFSTEPQVFPVAAPDGRLQETATAITRLLRSAGVI
jgi:GAF domain-containing protein